MHSEQHDEDADSLAFKPQAPTPPQSPKGVSLPHIDGNTLVSVSTTFSPVARHHGLPPNFAILSADSVFFYVHTMLLGAASNNGFKGLLDGDRSDIADLGPGVASPSIRVRTASDHSTTLNVILHSVYGLSCVQYAPSTNTLIEAVDLFPSYGIIPDRYINPGISVPFTVAASFSRDSPTPTAPAPAHPTASFSRDSPTPTALAPAHPTPLFTLLLSHASVNPLAIYALAGHHHLHALAVSTSSYLLSMPLHAVDDHAAARMGAIYLKRLAFLHLGRAEALKRIVEAPPPVHAPTRVCGAEEQQRLGRAWTLAVAYLAWEARADLGAGTLEAALKPLGDRLECHLCQYNLRERVRDVSAQWLAVKKTI